jgi:hypothetical protein
MTTISPTKARVSACAPIQVCTGSICARSHCRAVMCLVGEPLIDTAMRGQLAMCYANEHCPKDYFCQTVGKRKVCCPNRGWGAHGERSCTRTRRLCVRVACTKWHTMFGESASATMVLQSNARRVFELHDARLRRKSQLICVRRTVYRVLLR